MKFVAVSIALAGVASALPTPNATGLPFPLNATDISVPDYNTTLTGTGINISGQNPYDGTNYTLAAPYTPAGGDQQKEPAYEVKSNFDFQSLNLALNQELLELDLFHAGLAMFTTDQFVAAGLSLADIGLLYFMADQEVGHAEALTALVGPSRAAKQCIYQYPFTTVEQFIYFCQLVTRVGESGVLGFLSHLDSRPAASVLAQAIATEGRQQLILRQFQGFFPMPVWFEPGLAQSYAWTIQANYIKSCPVNNPRIEWQNFPGLIVDNQPDLLSTFIPAISTNRTLTAPGRIINITWEDPGKAVGPDLNYTTSTIAGPPKYLAFISQLNVTYAPLFNIQNNTAFVFQPNTTTFPRDPQVNGTMFRQSSR